MTLLKDVRLLLIIGLAILCLIALKMCASTYEPMSTTDTSTTDTSSAGVVAESAEKDSEAATVTAEESATAEATEKTEQVAESEEVTETAEVAETAENSTAAVSDEAETVVEEIVSEEAIAASAGDLTADGAATEEASAEVASTEAAPTEDAAAEPVTAQIQSVVPVVEPVVAADVEPIILRDLSASGEFMPDFNADVESVQDGLTQYSDKLEAAKTLLDKLKGVTQ